MQISFRNIRIQMFFLANAWQSMFLIFIDLIEQSRSIHKQPSTLVGDTDVQVDALPCLPHDAYPDPIGMVGCTLDAHGSLHLLV